MPYFSGPNGIREVADPGERFTQAFRESRLAKLYGDYFKTGNADLGQLARFDPEGAAKIKAEQERTGLAALLGNIYEAPDDQRQGLIAEAFRKDPTLGMNAAKMFDPRYRSLDASAGQREFESLIGGFSKEDQLKARRIAAGLDPRAVTGAMKFDTFKDAQGRPRPQRNNPTTGQVEIYVDETGQWSPLGGMTSQGAGVPSLPIGEIVQTAAGPVRNLGVDPADMEAVMADIQARGSSDNYRLPPRPANRPWTQNTPNPYGDATPRPTGGLGVGQSTADEAYSKEAAQQRAQLDALSRRGQLEADNAGLKTEAETAAKSRAEQAMKVAIRARDDREQLMLLSEAAGLLKSATSGGAAELGRDTARYFGFTTEGAKADAKLDTIAGKLTGKVPRFEGPQSNIDVQLYQKMAGDLANPKKTRGERIAAAQGMINLIRQYQSYTKQQGARPAPATGGIDDLLNKYGER